MAPCELAMSLTRKSAIRDKFPTFWEARNILKWFEINIYYALNYIQWISHTNFAHIDLNTYLDLWANHRNILILCRNQTSVTVSCRKIPASATVKSYFDGRTRFRPQSFQSPWYFANSRRHLYPWEIFPLFRRYGFVANTGI